MGILCQKNNHFMNLSWQNKNMYDVCIIALVSILIRVYMSFVMPIFLTLDSPDYIQSSIDIKQNLDFAALGDVRLPSYPIFLAIVQSLFPFRASIVSYVQSVLGVLAGILGYCLGLKLYSRFTGVTLSVFLLINPFYLLNERFVMSETLYLFTSLFLVFYILCVFRLSYN